MMSCHVAYLTSHRAVYKFEAEKTAQEGLIDTQLSPIDSGSPQNHPETLPHSSGMPVPTPIKITDVDEPSVASPITRKSQTTLHPKTTLHPIEHLEPSHVAISSNENRNASISGMYSIKLFILTSLLTDIHP